MPAAQEADRSPASGFFQEKQTGKTIAPTRENDYRRDAGKANVSTRTVPSDLMVAVTHPSRSVR